MRRFVMSIILVMGFVLLGGANPVGAREIRQGDQCVISATEEVNGDLFALCRTLDIQGKVNGNVFAAATDAEIRGTVSGDVYIAAGQLIVTGEVGDDLHFAGAVLHVRSNARLQGEQAHLVSISLSTTIDAGVNIAGGIVAAGYQLVLNDAVGQGVNFWGSALRITNRIAGDVDATVGDPNSAGISQQQTLLVPFSWDVELFEPGLMMTEGSVIEGDLRYTGSAEGDLQGMVKGKTTFTPVVVQPDLTQIISNQEQGGFGVYGMAVLREFFVLALIGVIGLLLIPRLLQQPIKVINTRPLPSLGVGLLTFVISFPVTLIVVLFILLAVFILLALQFDGLVIGLFSGTLLGTWLGGTSVFYFVTIFISRVLVCLVVGRGIVRTVVGDDGSMRITYLSLFTGAALIGVLAMLPSVGLFISAFAAFLGLGAILILMQSQFRSFRERGTGLQPARILYTRRSSAGKPLPPPMLDDGNLPLGMDNLPEGFQWWDEDK